MTKIGILIHQPLLDQLFTPTSRAALDELGEVVVYQGEGSAAVEAAIEVLHDCDIGIGSWDTPHPGSEGLLAACPKLRLWEHVAGAVKHFFNEHSAGRELVVASCKGAIADCVAEMTLGNIIVGLRQIIPNARANRQVVGAEPAHLKVLETSTVGVIAASEVGKRVLKLLGNFDCELLVYDPFLDAAGAQALGVELVGDLIELCRRADAVTLHTPLLDSTHGLLGAAHFQAMADEAIFINTSRGACIDEAALIAELEKGRLFAFIDVTIPEPAAENSPLRRLDNVVLTSHLAGPPTTNMGARCVADIRAFLAGGAPDCVVTEDMLSRIA
jgi:phosphoglycerate dehydrogenase-like enzyme